MAQRTPWQSLSWQQQTRVLLFWLVMIALVMGITSSIENGRFQWRSLGGNLATELMGGVLTFFVFQYVLDKRDEDTLKSRLIREMRSHDNATARNAVEELKARQWLFDGSLQKVDLIKANLQQAGLSAAKLQAAELNEANLQRAKLSAANLQGAELNEANLQGAVLWWANLQQADLGRANLQEAMLWWANLQGADLSGTNLQQADLSGANLQEALFESEIDGKVYKVKFDETTILPDGTHWTPETDMRRFTDPSHPDFWQPDWVKNES